MRLLLYIAFPAAVMLGQGGADDRFLSSASSAHLNGRPQKPMVRPTVHFEPNQGQVKGRTEWMAQARGASVYITGPEVVFALGNDNNAHMRFMGASPKPKSTGIEPLDAYSNYFIGPTAKTWFTGIPQYSSVRYTNVYPGIDIIYHTSNRDIEYDFVLAPGADPDQIELAFDREVHIDAQGDLVLGALRQHRPRVVQEGHEIASEYLLTPDNHIRIKLAHYGRQGPLTIDPVLEFSTYLGGPGSDLAFAVKLDASGNILVGGAGQTPASPTLDPFQQTNSIASGAYLLKMTPDAQHVLYYTFFSSKQLTGLFVNGDGTVLVNGSADPGSIPLKNAFQSACVNNCGFIGKLSPDGRTLLFFSYLTTGSLAVDQDGNAFVAGATSDPGLPIRNAFQSSLQGTSNNCFISKVSPTGDWLFSTYFGTGSSNCSGAAIGDGGSLVVVGYAGMSDIPLKNATQTQSNPGFIGAPFLAKLTPDGQSLLLSTYIGGEGFSAIPDAVATDQRGQIYVVGRAWNPFMTLKNSYQTDWENDLYGLLMKFDSSGQNLIYSTFFATWFWSLAVDPNENVYGIGTAISPDIALKNSLQPFVGGGVINSDVSLTKFAASGNSLVYSTLLGGTNEEWALGLTVDAAGSAYIVGETYSSDFPLKNPYQSQFGGGLTDAFLAKISDNSGSAAASPIQTTPASLTFKYVQGGPTPASQSVAATGSESYFLTTTPGWISAVPRRSSRYHRSFVDSLRSGPSAHQYRSPISIDRFRRHANHNHRLRLRKRFRGPGGQRPLDHDTGDCSKFDHHHFQNP